MLLHSKLKQENSDRISLAGEEKNETKRTKGKIPLHPGDKSEIVKLNWKSWFGKTKGKLEREP